MRQIEEEEPRTERERGRQESRKDSVSDRELEMLLSNKSDREEDSQRAKRKNTRDRENEEMQEETELQRHGVTVVRARVT